MDIAKFNAGNLIKQIAYKSFSPAKINQNWEITDPQLNTLLSEANRYLGELNGLSQVIPDIDFFIEMHVVKEATTSSKIEGTQTSIEEALLKKEELNPEKRNDWQEVHNYIEAMNQAIEDLAILPLSNRLLRNTHAMLLQGVRGENKMPGDFRSSQNWIGGVTLNDAVFIPPHHQEIQDLMGDLEIFLNDDDLLTPHLIKIGIAHYQFETIHPFLDGNGRIGRLLITLYLVSKKLLNKPSLYLSDFFERNRQLYYDNLSIVRTQNNLTQWLKFFLVGVIETSQKAIQTFKEIIQLREKIEKQAITTMGRKIQKAQKLVLQLYKKPFINVAEIAENLDCSMQTANSIAKDFIKIGILKETTGYKRNQIFVFEQYIRIFTNN
ncbi:MAG: Fic family protein [Cytophagales bacterium]|nr:MAG: Fic family protein [Cytophagales bacterium]